MATNGANIVIVIVVIVAAMSGRILGRGHLGLAPEHRPRTAFVARCRGMDPKPCLIVKQRLTQSTDQ